jgi:putative membrane protein
MKWRWMTTGVMVAALALAPALAQAQSSAPARSDKADKRVTDRGEDKSKLTAGDRKFVQEALKGGHAEVELGKLASEKAANDAVKTFGKRMAEDHGKASDELKKLAQDKGVSAPTELDGKHKRLHDRLAKLSGAEFDRAYMDEMVKDHRKDVKDFQREAEKAKDADVKAFASKTLPTLKDHLKEAESVHAQVKGSTAKTEKAKTEKK